MAEVAADRAFQSRMQELEGLLQEIEAIADPAARAKMGQIIQTLLEFHGAGLTAIFDRMMKAGELGRAAIEDLSRDELVGSLLLLYDLHPLDMESRVRSALDKARPALGGEDKVEVLGVSEQGVVRLRLKSTGHTCPSSAATMRKTIEEHIYDKAPEVTAIEFEGAEPDPGHSSNGFVPLGKLTTHNGKRLAPQGASL
ncbi:MAG TPA: NifU family protein [Tepidisphaeraceae bacterium]|jgi:Fe-S cluster biogenesis protein NfuA|nr:NifU family protein [Tepidisphaeraceae bacterium]